MLIVPKQYPKAFICCPEFLLKNSSALSVPCAIYLYICSVISELPVICSFTRFGVRFDDVTTVSNRDKNSCRKLINHSAILVTSPLSSDWLFFVAIASTVQFLFKAVLP